jgi:hypothetical protein
VNALPQLLSFPPFLLFLRLLPNPREASLDKRSDSLYLREAQPKVKPSDSILYFGPSARHRDHYSSHQHHLAVKPFRLALNLPAPPA